MGDACMILKAYFVYFFCYINCITFIIKYYLLVMKSY